MPKPPKMKIVRPPAEPPKAETTLPIVKAQVDRVHQVTSWILAGNSEHDIVDAIRQTFPNADAKPLIVAAMSKLAEAGEADSTLVKGWCIEATREIYRRALDVADHATALRAIRQLADLAGQRRRGRRTHGGAMDADSPH